MEQAKIALIGCGRYGMRHLDYLLTRDDVAVTALVSTNPEKLAIAGQKIPSAKKYNSFDDMIKSEELSAMIISVPPFAHQGMEKTAAEKGIHLYVEKPQGLDLDEVKTNADLIREKGIICAVGYEWRYENGIEEIRSLLSQKEIGIMQGTWMGGTPETPWWRDRTKSGGQVVEQCTHLIDLMRYLAGNVESVYAIPRNGCNIPLANYTIDDGSVTVFRFKNGTAAALSTGCFLDGEKVPSDIELTLYSRDLAAQFKWMKGVSYLAGKISRQLPPVEDLRSCPVAAFIEAIKTKNPDLIKSDYDDALQTLKTTMAIERSIAGGQIEKV
jgi:predicted dehydrogenase